MKRILSNRSGEGTLSVGVKIIIAVVVGALILGGLFALYRNVIFPKLNQKVEGMLHTEDPVQVRKDGNSVQYSYDGETWKECSIPGMGASATKPNYRRREEHGSAHWGKIADIDRKYRQEPPESNKILTQHIAIGYDTHSHRRNLNTLVVGGSGAGKTRFYAKPNLMQASTSFVVTDPKGELLRDTGYLLERAGYTDVILEDTLNQLERLQTRVHAGNPELQALDGDALVLADQICRYSGLHAKGILDEVTYREQTDRLERKLSALRVRRSKLIGEDAQEKCVEELRSLKRMLSAMPDSMQIFDRSAFDRLITKIYAEPDGALTFALPGGLQLRLEESEWRSE